VNYLYEYLEFLAKSASLVAVIVIGVVSILLVVARQKSAKGSLEVEDLSARYEELQQQMEHSLLEKSELKQLAKERKNENKRRRKEASGQAKGRVFVIDFKGGMEAKEVSALREEVTSVLAIAKSDDEVMIRLESGGGVVHGYGLCASQLQRIRDKGIHLTVAIDKVAASGGYMMACVAQHIIAAPFAIVGSIGVVAQLPNFNRLLQKHDIEYEQHTAGKYKRTLTLFGKNDDEGRQKFCAELESIHQQFKAFISSHRPRIDLDAVATGEHWLASEARKMHLVDEIRTSDDYLQSLYGKKQVIAVRFKQPKGLGERFGRGVSAGVESGLMRFWQQWRLPFGV
jgi:Periplasmic serine proteases (ClpP class)